MITKCTTRVAQPYGRATFFADSTPHLYTVIMKSVEKFVTKKSLGQNFLNNQHVPLHMVQAGDVKEGDIVLEIGPGTGALTKVLLSHGAKVLAIEADPRAIEVLQNTFETEIMAQKLTIIHDDVREIDFEALGLRPRAYKVIANIPYYLSGMLFRTFLETDTQPNTLVFLVQREVAQRIARDKKESLLSLSVKVFGDPKYVKTVGKGNFTPQPKVDSAIVSISNISKDRLKGIPQAFFFEVLHEAFKSKRKQLICNLKPMFEATLLTMLFKKHDLSLHIRAEDISLNTWIVFIHDLYTASTQS